MTITEVSEKYGLTTDTLRYYERIGLIPKVNRTSGGKRDYKEEDLNWVEFIKCMRSAGVGVEALIEYVDLFHKKGTIQARKEILIDERNKLEDRIKEMQTALERLNFKLDGYEERMLKFEEKLK